jgi:hypothetical protein
MGIQHVLCPQGHEKMYLEAGALLNTSRGRHITSALNSARKPSRKNWKGNENNQRSGLEKKIMEMSNEGLIRYQI